MLFCPIWYSDDGFTIVERYAPEFVLTLAIEVQQWFNWTLDLLGHAEAGGFLILLWPIKPFDKELP